MKVLVDATPLLGAVTGIGNFVSGVLDGLSARPGVDVATYGLSLRGWRGLRDRVPAALPVRARPLPAGALLRMWSRVPLPPAELLFGAGDVVHGTNFVVPPVRHGAAVVTVHDLTAVRYPELCTPTSLRYPALIRAAVNRGAWIHTPSQFVADEVVELLGAPADRVRAVLSGVPALAPSGAATPLDHPYVLAVGTIEPRKGFPTLVEAFEAVADSHPDLRLVIVGPQGWDQAALDAARDRSRHGDRVLWLGYVDDARRTALLAGATVFAFPSIYEGFGFPPLEAMQAGVPVVAAAAGSLPEVLGDAALLVPPRDVDALAAALTRAVEDTATREQLVAAGRRRVADFDWRRTADGIVELYEAACASSS